MAEDHYVPRLYLNNFVDPGTPRGRDPYLWIVDLTGDNAPRPRAPKNVAKRSGFYDWKQVGQLGPQLEKHYAVIESRAAMALKKMTKLQFSHLAIQDRYYLAKYVAYQVSRVPGTRDALNKWVNSLAAAHRNKKLSDEPWLQQHIDSYNRTHPDDAVSIDWFRSFMQDVSFHVTIPSDLPLALTVYLAEGLTMPMFRMKWAVFQTTDWREFFTSDEPVWFLPNEIAPQHVVSTGTARLVRVGGSNDGLELLFPVSPRVALLMHAHPGLSTARWPEVLPANNQQVPYVNTTLLLFARREIYCSSERLARWVTEKNRQCSRPSG